MEMAVTGDATSGKAMVPFTAGNKTTIAEKKLAEETAAVPDLNMACVKYNPSKVDVENTTAVTMMSEHVVQSAAALTESSEEASKIIGAAGLEITVECIFVVEGMEQSRYVGCCESGSISWPIVVYQDTSCCVSVISSTLPKVSTDN